MHKFLKYGSINLDNLGLIVLDKIEETPSDEEDGDEDEDDEDE